MSLVLKGNKLAFELLYERYFSKMVWYANGFMNDMQSAEDIVQEVFIKIIKQPQKFDHNRIFSTWIYTVTANMCKNTLRGINQNRKYQDFNQHQNHVQIHHEVDLPQLKKILKEKFESLSEKEKQLFVLRFEQDLSIKKISSIMQIPEGSVKSGLYYLLKKYAHILNYYLYEK